MSWDAIGALAELLGAAGVIASLLYLARQMRNSAADGRRAAAEAVLAKLTTAYERTSAHPQLADVFLRGSTELASLTPSEAMQFASVMHSFIRPYEELIYARRSGVADDWVWDNVQRSVVPILSTPGALEWWARRKEWYTPDFQSHVESVLPAQAAKRLKTLEDELTGKYFRAGVLHEADEVGSVAEEAR